MRHRTDDGRRDDLEKKKRSKIPYREGENETHEKWTRCTQSSCANVKGRGTVLSGP